MCGSQDQGKPAELERTELMLTTSMDGGGPAQKQKEQCSDLYASITAHYSDALTTRSTRSPPIHSRNCSSRAANVAVTAAVVWNPLRD
jgi:hypothetical protein